MSDGRLRELERRAAQGDLAAEAQVGGLLPRQGAAADALRWLSAAWERGNAAAGHALLGWFPALGALEGPPLAVRRAQAFVCARAVDRGPVLVRGAGAPTHQVARALHQARGRRD